MNRNEIEKNKAKDKGYRINNKQNKQNNNKDQN